ncbi:MAG: hypothetical protein P1U46_03005 [Patescibacteria group bacterium]|nr:hypothetical protein [Patescibacteria group bacterium]
MIHLKDIDSLDNNFLAENLLASSFLSEKKLIILKVENDISDEKIVFLENSLKNVPEDNIILFYFINPDKRSKIYKFLSTNAQVKDFSSN